MPIQIKNVDKTHNGDRLVICDGKEVGVVTKTRHDVTYACTCSARRTTKFLSDLRSKIQVHLDLAHSS